MECSLEKRGCGGCSRLSLSYEKLLEKKHADISALLGSFAKPEPVLEAPSPTHYRCKVTRTFTGQKDGRLAAGLYAARSHRVLVAEEDCLLEDPAAAAAANAAVKAAAFCRYEAFNEDKGVGLVRHVLVRRAAVTGQIMVILVAVTDRLPASRKFVEALRKECPQVTTVVLNVNTRRTSAVLGDRYKTLYGPGQIIDELCGCRFVISPGSFYQVNPVQTEKLYRTAINFAELTGKELVLDAYCGTGTIGLAAAKMSGCRLIGVELNKDAVKDAIGNAKRNQITNARFYAQDAGAFLTRMAFGPGDERPDVVFMDPPRSGSSEEFLTALCRLAPRRVVYISCGPDTQARDLAFLCKNGYRVKRIRPVDMFPYTDHLETVALLEKAEKHRQVPPSRKFSRQNSR